MAQNTLKITFGQAENHREAARERLQQAENGKRDDAIAQDDRFILDFEDFTDVEQLMRRSNLELLEVIVSERPESIRQTAEAVDRDYSDVHRNLEQLHDLGVIEFAEEGTSKKPILRAGAETLDFSFSIEENSDFIGPREASA